MSAQAIVFVVMLGSIPRTAMQRNCSGNSRGIAAERIHCAVRRIRTALLLAQPHCKILVSGKAQPLMNMPKATGPLPTLIAAVTVFVAVSITETLLEAPFAT